MQEGGRHEDIGEYGEEDPSHEGVNDPVVIAVKHCKFNMLTAEQRKEHGYLSTKQQKLIKTKMLRIRRDKQAGAQTMKLLTQQLAEHDIAVKANDQLTTTGVGMCAVSSTKDISIMCSPPISIGQFPKSRKFYAACVAMLCGSTTKTTTIKVDEMEVVNFFNSQAGTWVNNRIQSSNFENTNAVDKMKLLCMLAAKLRFANIRFVQMSKTDKWGLKAYTAAQTRCDSGAEGNWDMEPMIK